MRARGTGSLRSRLAPGTLSPPSLSCLESRLSDCLDSRSIGVQYLVLQLLKSRLTSRVPVSRDL